MRAIHFCAPFLTFGLSVASAQAEPVCAIPEALALHDLSLPIARKGVATAHRLVILTLGGAFTAGKAAGDPTATYPARLQVALTAALPGVTVAVVNDARPANTVEATIPAIAAEVAASGATLVIWGPGGRDMVRHPDVGNFATNLEAGIAAVRAANADLMLMDMQYVPMLEQWSRIEEYRDALRGTAETFDVPLFPRHQLMRAWQDGGTLDLNAAGTADQARMIKELFACVAKGLAAPIAEAVR